MRSGATFWTSVTIDLLDFELIGVETRAEARAELSVCGACQTRKIGFSGIDVWWLPTENAVRREVASGIGHDVSVEALDCRPASTWLVNAEGVQVRLDQWPNF